MVCSRKQFALHLCSKWRAYRSTLYPPHFRKRPQSIRCPALMRCQCLRSTSNPQCMTSEEQALHLKVTERKLLSQAAANESLMNTKNRHVLAASKPAACRSRYIPHVARAVCDFACCIQVNRDQAEMKEADAPAVVSFKRLKTTNSNVSGVGKVICRQKLQEQV